MWAHSDSFCRVKHWVFWVRSNSGVENAVKRVRIVITFSGWISQKSIWYDFHWQDKQKDDRQTSLGVWIGYLLLPTPHHFHQVSRFCSLSLSLTRWRCWFALASWLPGFLMQWSLCGQLLDGQTPSPYNSLWCQPSWQNQQQCTTPSFTRSSITNLPVAKLVVWRPPRRNLWKTSGKISEAGNEWHPLCFRILWGSSHQDMLPS